MATAPYLLAALSDISRNVADWVDRSHLRGRLVYFHVRPRRQTDSAELHRDSLVRKLAQRGIEMETLDQAKVGTVVVVAEVPEAKIGEIHVDAGSAVEARDLLLVLRD